MQPDLATITSVLWHIWKARNDFIFRRRTPNPDQVVFTAIAQARSYQSCLLKTLQQNSHQQHPVHNQILDLSQAIPETLTFDGSNRLRPESSLCRHPRAQALLQRWRPPDPGVLKVNIDGSFPMASHEGSIACVCRDSSGKLIDGFSRTIKAASALIFESDC